MTRTEALRRLCLSHLPTAKRIGRGTETEIEATLNNAGALESYLRSAARITRAELDHLLSSMVSLDAPPSRATQSDIMTAQTVAALG